MICRPTFQAALAVSTLLLSPLLLSGCSGESAPSDAEQSPKLEIEKPENEAVQGNIRLVSSTFAEGKTIPKKHTGEGEDVSPQLSWSNVPVGTKSLALICDDPDAPSRENPRKEGPWVHWVIYNLPAETAELPEGVARDAELDSPFKARQGHNSWPSDNVGYMGPMPPPGSGPHRYFFKLYALDTVLELPAADADKQTLLDAMEGHVLDWGQLMGVYERK